MELFLFNPIKLVETAFSNSVILNKATGDATLILNDQYLTNNSYLFNRVLTALVQFTTVSSYPPKTPSLNRIYTTMHTEYVEYQKRISNHSYHRNVSVKIFDASIEKSLKRLGLAQHTLAGATVYALSKSDTSRRLSNFQRISGKKLAPGPALLVQRECPSKAELKSLSQLVHDFGDKRAFLWDNRIFLELLAAKNEAESGDASHTFKIQPLNLDLVKEFESLTTTNFLARKNLYSYLGTTPGSHLHTIPVLKHVGSNYIAIPTLQCYSDQTRFSWKTFNASINVFDSKFNCCP
jgi:hypothetical protein